MDPDKFKTVAINIVSYKMLKELAEKRFELPVSLSKTTEFLIKKSHDKYIKNNGKSAR